MTNEKIDERQKTARNEQRANELAEDALEKVAGGLSDITFTKTANKSSP